MITLEDIVERILVFAPTITQEPLLGAIHAPAPWGVPNQCFTNALRKVEKDGGSALYGWVFQHRAVLAIPGPGYLIAVNHAVWHTPDKTLFDVTPFLEDAKQHPLAVNGQVLFLADSTASPLVDE